MTIFLPVLSVFCLGRQLKGRGPRIPFADCLYRERFTPGRWGVELLKLNRELPVAHDVCEGVVRKQEVCLHSTVVDRIEQNHPSRGT